MRNNKIKNIIFVVSLLLILSVVLVGCNEKTIETEAVVNQESYVYKEEKLNLPEGVVNVLDICTLTDGGIRLAGANADMKDINIFTSNDAGANWVKDFNVSTELGISDQSYGKVFLSADGSVFCENADNIEIEDDLFQADMKYSLIKKDGTITELSIDLKQIEQEEWVERWGELFEKAEGEIKNSISICSFTENGRLLAADLMGNGYLIDPDTGKILTNYDIRGDLTWVEDLCSLDDIVLAVSFEGISIYDLETGDSVSESSLGSEMAKALEGLENNTISTYSMLQRIENQPAIYYCNASGLYEFTKDEPMKYLLDSNETYMKVSQTYTQSMAVVNEEKILLSIKDITTQTDTLYSYTRVESENALHDSEITVWALKDSNDVQQAVSVYKSEHSNVKINIEIGMTGDDTATVSDVITKLNTEIMAGNGPDVLFLDNLPIDSYVEKGILADLTDVVNSTAETDGIFENIINHYKVDDKIYSIPSRFAVLLVEGNKEVAEASHSIESLVEYGERIKEEIPDAAIFPEDDFGELARFFYYSSISSWMKEDEIDKEALKNFYLQLKRIHKLFDNVEEASYSNSETDLFMTVYYYQLIDSEIQIATDYLQTAGYQLSGIQAVGDVVPDTTYNLVNTDAGRNYLPSAILGVNNKSDNIDASKDFVSSVLSFQMQSKDTGSGNPVNKKAFAASMELDEESELEFDEVTLQLKFLTEENKAKYTELVESLNVPVNRDGAIMDAVFEPLNSYLKGDMSVEEAVDSMTRKIDLYLSE